MGGTLWKRGLKGSKVHALLKYLHNSIVFLYDPLSHVSFFSRETVDCMDAIFVMTSNLGQREIADEAIRARKKMADPTQWGGSTVVCLLCLCENSQLQSIFPRQHFFCKRNIIH